MANKEIKRAKSAEAVGVSSAVVQEFVDYCLENKKELHSVIVLRHGQVACEAYRAPYDATKAQMVYSVSKSFTATAIAFAIEEGYFSLSTKLLDIFPEYRKSMHDEKLEKITVQNLLSMSAGKDVSPFMDRSKDNWLEQILESGWYDEPDTSFKYISENMYVLCAIIHKMVGQSVMEFLTPRLFEPLGIEGARWETCPKGIETGGWGLVIKPMDIAKFTLCYQQMGVYDGKQVIPEHWVKEATKLQVENIDFCDDRDSVVGYGYCFWRCAGYEKAYRCDGMFSQFGIVFEDLDACVIVTCGELDEQAMRDIVWEYFPKAFIEDDKNAETQQIQIEPYPVLKGEIRSGLEKKIQGKTIDFIKTIPNNLAGFPLSVIPLPGMFMEFDRAGNIDEVSFDFYENDMKMTWSEGDEVNSVMIGLDGERRWDEIIVGQLTHETCSTARWNSETELEIHIRAIDVTAKRVLTFKFEDNNRVSMIPSCVPQTKDMLASLESSVKAVIKQPLLQAVVVKALPKLSNIVVDATQRGKFK